MWPLPRERLWAIFGGQAIAIVALWPTYYPYRAASPSEQIHAASDQSAQHRESDTEVSFLGIRLGELILGVATVMLWAATARLVDEGKKASERQSRAYVLVEKASVFSGNSAGAIMFWESDTGGSTSHDVWVGPTAMVLSDDRQVRFASHS